jgi:UDP-glucose 4-epimerase
LLCIDSADNKILNVGTGVEITINDLFNKVKKITKSNLDPIYLDKRPGDIYRSVFNIDKLKRELNYEPRTSLEDGLIKTIEYFNQ